MLYTVHVYIPTKKDLISTGRKGLNYLDKLSYTLEDYLFAKYGKWFWKLVYQLTGQCGSRRVSHTPIYGNSLLWLWEHTDESAVCTVCNTYVPTVQSRGFNEAKYRALADSGREQDMKQLERSYATATNEAEKKAVLHAISNLRNEHGDGLKASLRAEVVKATRDNDTQRLKEIHENLGDSRKWRND